MAEIILGTSGYDYPEWVGEGRFYPASLARSRGDWLTYYASRFNAVELNFTYYGETNQDQLAGMIKRVDPQHGLYLLEGEYIPNHEFQFFIKAYAALTHQITTAWPNVAQKFQEDTAPLTESGKLGGVLVQFPSRLHACSELREYLAGLAEALAGMPLVVELRHRSWFTPEWRARLGELPVVVCNIDAPREAQLPLWVEDGPAGAMEAPSGLRPTSTSGKMVEQGFSYLRLHGRREGRWWTGDNASRYEYNYTPMELSRIAAKLLNTGQSRGYAMFNNHRHGAAAINAQELQTLLNRAPE